MLQQKSNTWLTRDNTPVSPGMKVWTPNLHFATVAASNFERVLSESGASFRLTREHADGYVRVVFSDGTSAIYSVLQLRSAEPRR